jgi:hypothetical protein
MLCPSRSGIRASELGVDVDALHWQERLACRCCFEQVDRVVKGTALLRQRRESEPRSSRRGAVASRDRLGEHLFEPRLDFLRHAQPDRELEVCEPELERLPGVELGTRLEVVG